jgi:short-subunit dehydrogenase
MLPGTPTNAHPNSRTALSFLVKAGISVGAVFAAAKLAGVSTRKPRDLRGKIALITGSRGLGLAVARELGREGARIALCARDSKELNDACRILARERIEATSFPADISDPSQIGPLVSRVLDRLGQIDILVNNAGEIRVGPFESFTHSDYEHAMNLMFWAPLNLTFAVLPAMRRQRGGQIVNITSVGGRVSVPRLLPYICAKFALVGFSTGLGTELRPEGVHVLTVIPGLMRTGSYLKAQFKGQADREFVWFGLLGNLPGFSVAAEYAAHSIRKALQNERRVCVISLPARVMIACDAMMPETTRRLLEAVNSFLLPGSNGSQDLHSGSSLNARFGRAYRVLTVLGRRAASNLNEQ